MKNNKMKRRDFLKQTGLATTVVATPVIAHFPAPAFAQDVNLNSKLNIACIGISGQGGYSVENVKQENIVAFCDVDQNFLEQRREAFPEANLYIDFRKMYEEMGDRIDAVTVCTPDHTHAVAALMGMKLGKHCYCEKPLAHNVAEVRRMMETAREKNLVTQMGTQIHAEPNYRRVVELIRTGAIGKVTDIHVWCGTRWGGRPYTLEGEPVPENLDWDLWLGPAPERPYHSQYFAGAWRCFWAFGNGGMGDMACHFMDLPYWALGLRDPATIEAFCEEKPDAEMSPGQLEVHFTYPQTDRHPAVNLIWQHGGLKPAILKEYDMPDWGSGVVFVGDEGLLLADYTRYLLFPEETFADFTPPPPFIAESPGQHREWIAACKNGKPEDCLCNFGYSGTLAEAVLLGLVAFRTETKLEWDPVRLKATNCPAADQYLSREYRQGWEV